MDKAFLSACQNGQKSVVTAFLKRGDIKINKRDSAGNTALHYASESGSRDIVKLLLDAGADPALANNASLLPLHHAATNGSKDIIKLLAPGSDINATDQEGQTPLIYALKARRTEAAICLLSLGADPAIRIAKKSVEQNADSLSPLDIAAANGMRELLPLLAPEGITGKDNEGNTLLHRAVSNNQNEIVAALLAIDKTNVNALNDTGLSALFLAVARSNLHIVDLLLKHGAKASLALHDGNTPLHHAAQTGNKFTAALLLDARAVVNARNTSSETPLIIAARCGHSDLVELLIARKADVNAADNSQQTALSYAGASGFGTIVELLLEAGAKN